MYHHPGWLCFAKYYNTHLVQIICKHIQYNYLEPGFSSNRFIISFNVIEIPNKVKVYQLKMNS